MAENTNNLLKLLGSNEVNKTAKEMNESVKGLVKMSKLGAFMDIKDIIMELGNFSTAMIPLQVFITEIKAGTTAESIGLMNSMFELMRNPQVKEGQSAMIASLNALIKFSTESVDLATTVNTLASEGKELNINFTEMSKGIQNFGSTTVEAVKIAKGGFASFTQALVAISSGEGSPLPILKLGLLDMFDKSLNLFGINLKFIDDKMADLQQTLEDTAAATEIANTTFEAIGGSDSGLRQ